MMPVSVSPEPAVPSPALPVGLTKTLPSGAATSVRVPFRTTISSCAAANSATARARSSSASRSARAEQSQHLAFVRREDDGRVALFPRKLGRPRGERVEAVGVDDDGRRASFDHLAHEAARRVQVACESGADGDDGRALGQLLEPRPKPPR